MYLGLSLNPFEKGYFLNLNIFSKNRQVDDSKIFS